MHQKEIKSIIAAEAHATHGEIQEEGSGKKAMDNARSLLEKQKLLLLQN
jgi:hypothetical protein